MKPVTTVFLTAAAIALSAAAIVMFTSPGAAAPSNSSAISRLERGRYIVNQVGLCIDCHSPRTEKGEFIEGKHLTGSPIAFLPTVPMPWAGSAPRLAGLPEGFTADNMVHFLMTGERPNGRPAPLPPMPPYRLSREDAEAVVMYLKSMPTGAR